MEYNEQTRLQLFKELIEPEGAYSQLLEQYRQECPEPPTFIEWLKKKSELNTEK